MALKSLIVCPDTKALQVLRQIFEDLGVGVEHCEHSAVATSRVATGSFDAIVIDAADPHGLQLMSTARHSSENHTSDRCAGRRTRAGAGIVHPGSQLCFVQTDHTRASRE